MNILGVGGAELILILLIMIVVAGPKRMIRWSYVLGVYLGKARDMWAQVAMTLQKEFEQAGVDIDVPKELPTKQNIIQSIEKATTPITRPIQETVEEMQRLKEQSLKGSFTAKAPITRPAQTPTQPPQDTSTPSPESPSFGTWSTANTTQKADE